MKRQLPDINVLLALLWPGHQCYRAAQAWFDQSGHRAWATNLLTQLGVLRLLTSYAVVHQKVSPSTASSALKLNIQHEAHEFWPLDRTVTSSLEPVISRVRGHRQWTDAALLCQTAERDGVLVTFDAGIKELATNELKDRILLLDLGQNRVNGTT